VWLGGGEYKKLNSFFHCIGIRYLVSCPHAHQQNGSAERKHRHIVAIGLSLLALAFMPLKFWDEAFTIVVYLINRTPSKVINHETPLERLFHVKPNYLALRTLRCVCWPNLRPYNDQKLQFRSKQCAFLGYSSHHKGFKCLDISEGHVYISRDVVFDDSAFPFAKLHSNAGARLREISLLPTHLIEPESQNGVCLTDIKLTNSPNEHVEIANLGEGYTSNRINSQASLEENGENLNKNSEEIKWIGPYCMQGNETSQNATISTSESAPESTKRAAVSASESTLDPNNTVELVRERQ
jgi:hypothetical protein